METCLVSEDNTRLNSIVGHDSMNINVKYRTAFTIRPNAFLIIGTNKPVKITDAKAGNTRRLIDVHPTGVKVDPSRYHVLMENINFELGSIAAKCLRRYREMGTVTTTKGYVPTKMMMLTDTFYNFVEAHYDIFKHQDGVQLKRVWELYKQYCEEANILKRLQYHEVRDELSNYFIDFKDRHFMADKEYRSWSMWDLRATARKDQLPLFLMPPCCEAIYLRSSDNASAFNNRYSTQPAQVAGEDGNPTSKWANVRTTLKDINTTQLHYV